MNYSTLRTFLRWTIFSIIFGTMLNSCQDSNEIKLTKRNINYDDPLFQYITEDLKFDPNDVVDYDEFYLVEGDIMFSKADFKSENDPGGRTAQFAANALVFSGYQNNMTIFVDPSVKTSATNWGPAIQDAVDMWNSISCTKIRFSIVSSNARITITSDNGSLPESKVGFAKLPTSDGKPGNLVQLNVSLSGSLVRSEKMIVVLHELGHTMGLRHTNAKSLGQFNDQYGTQMIPETTDVDTRSVMNSPTNAISLSYADVKSVQNIYPALTASCPAPFYRYYSTGARDHFYTTSFIELGRGRDGYTFLSILCHIYGAQANGTVPFYRYYNRSTKDHYYSTTFIEPDGYDYELTAGYIYTSPAPGRLPLYRYWSQSLTDHLYTTDYNQLKEGTGSYVLERIAGYVLP